ncbi:DEAD-domain-containing protein [Violaceomyces palustris]|uniref:DEAD-domain-containing protein n=1 Tax=Violaceomyces palustris TaxID=1673888 RepID=A0ACD0P1S0_9BASI|nr:DEAD-domain-containing protein [Violaceomyces palustris]
MFSSFRRSTSSRALPAQLRSTFQNAVLSNQRSLNTPASSLSLANQLSCSSPRFLPSLNVATTALSPYLLRRFSSLPTPNRQEAAATAHAASAQPEIDVTPNPKLAAAESEPNEKPLPIKDETFASMKRHISYPTWKALNVEPFGYTNMSDVQRRVLHLLPELASNFAAESQMLSDGEGRDLLVKAKTGTGKTIAFLVPAIEARIHAQKEVFRASKLSQPWKEMLERNRPGLDLASLDKHGRHGLLRQFNQNTVGSLILSPTRELATQIANEAKKLLTHHDDMHVQLLVGGASKGMQLRDWRRSRPDIVVATPGRLLDLLKTEGMVKEAMSACQTLILDEADTLLEMGFKDELDGIMEFLPSKDHRMTMLFSATVSKEVNQIARKTLNKEHRYIDCVPKGEENVHKHIPQFVSIIDKSEDQIPHVLRLIAHDQLVNPGKSKVIVFAPTTKLTQMLNRLLIQAKSCLPLSKGTMVYEIHSQKDQNARFRASDMFRKDTSGGSVLVTSDVSARGVDYPGTTRVIQVGVPSSKDQYIHRIGRTGRAGADGRADIVLLKFESGFLHEQLYDLPVKSISTSDLEKELEELVEQVEKDPREFNAKVREAFAQAQGSKDSTGASSRKGSNHNKFDRNSRSDRAQPLTVQTPLDRLSAESIHGTVKDSLQSLDPDTVNGVVYSLLGYYVARATDLRTNKSSLIDGIMEWSTEGAGLEKPPYVGEDLLKKLGAGSPRSRGGKFGRDGGRDGGRSFRDRARGDDRRGGGSIGAWGGQRDGRFSSRGRESRDSWGERESGFDRERRGGGDGGNEREDRGSSRSWSPREGNRKAPWDHRGSKRY